MSIMAAHQSGPKHLGLLSLLASPTPGTYSQNLQSATQNLVATQIFRPLPLKFKGGAWSVVDPHAKHTAQMIVKVHVSVVAGFATAKSQFVCQAHLVEQLQIAIDRAQADFRQLTAHYCIKLRSGRMRMQLLKCFQNKSSLPRIAVRTVAGHRGSCACGPYSYFYQLLLLIYFNRQVQPSRFFP
jgi:hypothetical protein